MLKRIKDIIKKNRKVKYQKIIFSKKDIVIRDQAISLIYKTINNKEAKKKNCSSCSFFTKNLNKINFNIFYKKFNSRLQLKDKYCLYSYKKKSNKNACFKSYILFSKFLMKDRLTNDVQKLNTILKINDLLILMYKKNKHSHILEKFKINIEFEKKLINKYL